jgi:hypothetical protein
MRRPSPRLAFALGLAVLAALPLAARALGGSGGVAPRCAGDGRPLGAAAVRVVSGAAERRFCGVSCADRWCGARGEDVGEVFVVDEASGAEVPAGAAHFVRSVVAHPATKDRVHAFARREDALRHARAYAGALLDGEERPFAPEPHAPEDADAAPGSGP